METKSKKPYCIGRRTGKSGLRLPMRNQAGIKKYATGTNSSPEHPSGFQNREKPNLAHGIYHHLRRNKNQNKKDT